MKMDFSILPGPLLVFITLLKGPVICQLQFNILIHNLKMSYNKVCITFLAITKMGKITDVKDNGIRF